MVGDVNLTSERHEAQERLKIFWNISRDDHLDWCPKHCGPELRAMPPECIDKVHSGFEALEERYARVRKPVANLGGWARANLHGARIDWHRKYERGRFGALQKPRVPGWLKDVLSASADGAAEDRLRVERLVLLARKMIEFAGVEASAGTPSGWPTLAWLEILAPLAGAPGAYDEAALLRDIDHVVRTARRLHPEWYAERIEAPLFAKSGEQFADPDDLGAHGRADAEACDRADEQPLRDAVTDILQTVDILLVTTGTEKELADAVRELLKELSGVAGKVRLPERAPADEPVADQAAVLQQAIEEDRLDALVEEVLRIVRDAREAEPDPD